jgi:hypothetical protein
MKTQRAKKNWEETAKARADVCARRREQIQDLPRQEAGSEEQDQEDAYTSSRKGGTGLL